MQRLAIEVAGIAASQHWSTSWSSSLAATNKWVQLVTINTVANITLSTAPASQASSDANW
jgi:hypothetical protein